jgi:hypothetical protein
MHRNLPLGGSLSSTLPYGGFMQYGWNPQTISYDASGTQKSSRWVGTARVP